MEAESERLIIIPLKLELFKRLIEGESIKKDLQLSHDPLFDFETRQAMQGLYEKALLNPKNYCWRTNWQIILKKERIPIGSACFMDEPNALGEVEIGYGIDEVYRNKGYMSEAVQALTKLAFENGAKAVKAETEKDNTASHKVLIKNGFKLKAETAEYFYWELKNEL